MPGVYPWRRHSLATYTVLAKQYEEQNHIVYPLASADAAVDGRRANIDGAF
jgi:hypothetical protein